MIVCASARDCSIEIGHVSLSRRGKRRCSANQPPDHMQIFFMRSHEASIVFFLLFPGFYPFC